MDNRGITLMSLVIVIVVMLILAGVSISAILNAGTVETAKEVAFKSEAKDIKDAWESKIIGIDSTFLDYANVTDILSELNANEEILAKLEIQNGEVVYKNDMCTPEEKEWFEQVGIFGGVTITANVKTNVRVLGETIVTTKKQGMDVVVALDRSGSMLRKYGSSSNLRIYEMTNVINNLMKQVLKNDERNRIGIVSFGGDASEYSKKCGNNYTTDVLALDRYSINGNINKNFFYYSYPSFITNTNFMNSKKVKLYRKMEIINLTGTYIQGGAYRAYQILKNRKDKTNLPVIFLITDGAPNDNVYNVDNGLHDNILNKPSTTNKWGSESTTQSNSIYRGIQTVKTLGLIKKSLPKSMIYTISIAELSNTIDKRYVQLLLNPNTTTINNAITCNSSKTAEEGEIKGLKKGKLKEFGNNVKELGTDYHYADGFSIGALSQTKFEQLFAKFIEQIEINLEKEYTIAENNSITGVYELDSDNLQLTTKIKNDAGQLVDHTYKFTLAEEELDGTSGIVKIKVKAAAYTKSAEGTPSLKVQETEETVESQITIQEIKDGVDPNLYYLDGTIKWNVRSQYKDSGGLAQKAIEKVEKAQAGKDIIAEVEEVILELPVNVLEEN